MFKSFYIQKIEFLGYALLMLSFFLPIKINSVSIIILALITGYKLVKKHQQFKGYAGLWSFPLLFVVLLFGMLYTADLKEGWAIIERHLGLLVAPVIVISITQFTLKQKQLLLDVFIAMAVLVGLYCLGAATLHYINTGTVYTPTQKDHFVYNHFMHQRLTAPVHLHAIYYTFYLAVANVAILNQLISQNSFISKTRKFIFSIVFLFFCVLIFLLKSSLFAFIFPVGCLLLVFLKFRKKITSSLKLKLLIVGVVLISAVYMYQGVKTKIETFSISYDLSDNHLKPLATRLAMWECSLEVIKNNWAFGVGTGDGRNETLEKYEQMEFNIGLDGKFNSHNMYLQYWLSNGILTLLLFLGILVFLFVKAIKSKNMVFFSFILFFSFFCITESAMLRQKGIVFFVFMSAMFYWCPTLWNFQIKEK
ncbi:MAG: O-antigen ligase family protein [Vicingaceae bacterium]